MSPGQQRWYMKWLSMMSSTDEAKKMQAIRSYHYMMGWLAVRAERTRQTWPAWSLVADGLVRQIVQADRGEEARLLWMLARHDLKHELATKRIRELMLTKGE
jgi:hypothetical protein